MSHTPGPWHVNAYDQNTAIVYAHTGHPTTPIVNIATATDANARLIAAAPDLLKELIATRAILDAVESHCKNDAGLRGLDHADEGRQVRHGLQLFLATPSAAIAKATLSTKQSGASHG